MAKEVFEQVFNTGRPPADIVREKGLAQVADADSLGPIVEEAIASNDKAVQDYIGGQRHRREVPRGARS